MRARWVVGLGLWLAMSSNAARAQPEPELPAPLEPWRQWVLHDLSEHGCTFVGSTAQCFWPGVLRLVADAQGARFEQALVVDRERELALPGSAEHWPLDVMLDATPGVVLARDGAPVLRVPAGEHVLRGRFAWAHVPEVLAVPAGTARVELSVSGTVVEFPRRDESGLWLAQSAAQGAESESLQLEVYRQLADGNPLRVTTRLLLRASGRARELSLGRVLLDGSVPLSLSADLPARLDAQGNLTVQVRAGSFTVDVVARLSGEVQKLVAPAREAPWPSSEIWVWQADELLRQVTVSGAPGIDPARTDLPGEWRALPAYVLGSGAALQLKTERRGEPEPPPNQLSLQRELWLDLEGGGYTVRDVLAGELNRSFRLDLVEGQLGHVSAGGADQLITEDPSGKRRGVELRTGQLALVAEWRGQGVPADLLAVGWSEDVRSLALKLNLPPGYSLLAASGVDEVNTWLTRWDLLDFFLALLVALALGRLLGPLFGLLGLVTMVLCMHEADAPLAVWLTMAAALALLRLVKPGKARGALRLGFGVVVLSLLGIALPFARDQLRTALYPQLGLGDGWLEPGFLESPLTFHRSANEGAGAPPPAAPPVPAGGVAVTAPMVQATQGFQAEEMEAADMAEEQKAAEPEDAPRRDVRNSYAKSKRGGLGSSWNSDGDSSMYSELHQDPNAVVQTGPGVPSWSWHQERLGWSGPVERGHRMQLYLLGPSANRVLNLLRVLLIALLLWRMLRASRDALRNAGGPPSERPPAGAAPGASTGTGTSAAAVVALGLAVSCALGASTARAQIPDAELRGELRNRLTEPPRCLPDCESISELALRVAGTRLEMRLDAHAGARVGLSLPGPAKNWLPAQVLVDGKPSQALALMPDGFLHLRLEPGRHRVELSGLLPASESLTLSFGETPQRVSAEAPDWEVEGVRADGRVGSSIQLTRKLAAGAEAAQAQGELPSFLELTRVFEISTSWKVVSVLRRISPTGSPVVLRIPPLPGEAVIDAQPQLEGGQLLITLGRDQDSLSWSSSLPTSPALPLLAGKGGAYSEVWVLRCGPVWHCSSEGLAPVVHKQAGNWQPEYRPYPGEQLTLRFDKPRAAEGQSTTIDAATLALTPGIRILEAELELALRSSTGGVHVVTLPAQAKVQSLTVGGAERPIRQQGGKLSFNVQPGPQQVQVRWQEPGGLDMREQAPRVDLGARAANAIVSFTLPSDRWLLWAGGPSWGPAVLFWGYLLFVALLALGLGRVPGSPLGSRAWLLLALGLTQLELAGLVVIVGWFFALAARTRWSIKSALLHNVLQLGLMFWTLAAGGLLYSAVESGLLMQPDMQVEGALSDGSTLRWIVDNVSGPLPQPTLISVSVWWWKVAMLLWALWLAASLLRWLPWAWRSFSTGERWRTWPPPRKPPLAPAAPKPVAAPVVPPTE
jgi:hypothetical protein